MESPTHSESSDEHPVLSRRRKEEEEDTGDELAKLEEGHDTTMDPAAAAAASSELVSSVPTSDLGKNILDLDSIKDAVWYLFPDRRRRLSQFWLLMVLSSVIATAGVVNDSTATVIGAMIVAPLMTPILGTMLAIVLTDPPNFFFSLFHVLAGAGIAVLIGYLYGLPLDDDLIAKEYNDQVASRIQPNINDLISALATGVVGSIALVRRDIAGSLPGVAIAISLVPPLCVIGLTLSSGQGQDATGALLLFSTNFASIMVVGVVIMQIYRIPKMANRRRANLARTIFLVLLALLCIVAVPLAFSSLQVKEMNDVQHCLEGTIDQRLEEAGLGWFVHLVVVRAQGGGFQATATIAGEPPFPTKDDITVGAASVKEVCNVDALEVRFIPLFQIEA